MSFFNTNEKSSLRAKMKRKRVTLKSLYPRSATQLASRFPAEILTRQGLIIAGYRAFRGEIDPQPLMEKLRARGAQLCLPVVEGEGKPLTFRAWTIGDELETNSWGIEEPSEQAAIVTPDIVLVPFLAFDMKGRRLGYGGGYYDRTLKALRANNPDLCVIGLGYAAQRVPKVPHDHNDQTLDWVLCEAGANSITGKTP